MSLSLLSDPSHIFAEMDAQPPLMRSQVVARYIGMEVDWLITLANGSEDHSGQAHLLFQFDSRSVRMVTGEVSLSEYPQLRATRAGSPLRIRGTIRKITTLSIELEIAELLLAQTTEATH